MMWMGSTRFATIGDGAVIDRDFNTVDVCIMVETSNVTDKYARHFMGLANPVPVAAAGGFALPLRDVPSGP
ncbi:hypothetical protein NBZ79_04610 [Sneathiella marina]|uniref:Uncharacterized protein n=1 Tax=Sneathiella marina TaxID=2950108 RepID=A0ABY4W804_9PROT|nr:hypothetical protein [Sneathiella marina]USG62258.1 hypothetical protein NBZ79_04610 [Sneathiella marina]